MLAGKTVLVVEDEYFLADDMRRALVKAGAAVVGPYATVGEGLAAVERSPNLDYAALDINLLGEPSFPLADALRNRGIPFVFTTGYDHAAIPSAYQDTPRCEKPINLNELVRLLVTP